MRRFLVIALLGLGGACTLPRDAIDSSQPPAIAAEPARTIIDSILPPDEEMRRFRADGGPPRDSLSGGASSREQLVRAFLAALAAHDTVTIRSLVMGRLEFADLYYPASQFARPPYRSPLGLVWTQIQLNSEKGIVRATRRLGGQRIAYVAADCPAAPERFGSARLHNGCRVRYVTSTGDTAARRLFGPIIEVAGRWKFVSYANDM